jgi:hypothetical protein
MRQPGPIVFAKEFAAESRQSREAFLRSTTPTDVMTKEISDPSSVEPPEGTPRSLTRRRLQIAEAS